MAIHTHPQHLLITHERLLSLVYYDPDSGQFTWLVRRRSHGRVLEPGDPVTGCIDRHGYRIIGLDQRRYQASRLVWFYVHKEWPIGEVDHQDRDILNNRISNLRDAGLNRGLQRANQKVRKDSKSGLKGVQYKATGYGRKRWRARVAQKTIGMFATKEEAKAAYDKAAKEAFGEFFRPE